MDIEIYKKTLKEKGMTYEDLAQKTGLSLGGIKRIMAGIAKYPRIDTIEMIEHALGLDQQEIITSSAFPALTLEEREILALYSNLDHMGKKLVRQTLVTLNSSESVHIQKNKNS